MSTDAQKIVSAAKTLEIPERIDRWTHLSLCVLDAVFSINANYVKKTRPTVLAYATHVPLPHHIKPAAEVAGGMWAADEQPLSAFLAEVEAVGSEQFAALVNNRQLTSTGGHRKVLKAEAVRRYAAILVEHKVDRLADVATLLLDRKRLDSVETDLAKVPGHGTNGVRMSYLWMLAGDDNTIKPDRMVLRWLHRVLDRTTTTTEARELFATAATELGVTSWQLDHAVWNRERTTAQTR